MVVHPTEVNQTRLAVLRAGVWQFGRFRFAANKTANNKFCMDELVDDPERFSPVARTLARLTLPHKPDALWGVHKGGQDIAVKIGEQLDLPVILFDKDPANSGLGIKAFRYRDEASQQLAIQRERLVGFEDVTTELTSVIGTLAVLPVAQKTVAIKAIWRRGLPEAEKPLPADIPIEWLVEEPVPNHITRDHPFYRRYGHLAVGQLEEFAS